MGSSDGAHRSYATGRDIEPPSPSPSPPSPPPQTLGNLSNGSSAQLFLFPCNGKPHSHGKTSIAASKLPPSSSSTTAHLQQLISWKEVKILTSLSGPLILGNLLNFLLLLVSLTFVGHCGEIELSGAAIANSFAVVTGFSVVLGMCSALEMLCGQAYGAGHYQKLGVYLQRAIFVLNLTSIPLALLWANMEAILVFLGQDATIASKAGAYSRWLIPTLFAYSTSQPFVKFLQSQSVVRPFFIIYMCTLILHVPICWFMVFRSGMGYLGAAIANSISYWFNVLQFALYVTFSSRFEKTRAPLTWKALDDLGSFFQLAIPSAAMICLEWWSYEVLIILAGLLSNPELQTAAISICGSTESLIYMFPLGFGTAASTRVSNELGAGNPRLAQAVVYAALALTFVTAMCISCTLLLIRNVWGRVYSNEEEVIDAVNGLVPLLAVSTAVDSMQAVLSGVARGAGWQKAGAFINLGSFYAIGLPFGCLLAFVFDFQGKGLWLGLIVGASVQFLSFITITHFTNWNKEAVKAAVRMGSPYTLAAEPLLNKLTSES